MPDPSPRQGPDPDRARHPRRHAAENHLGNRERKRRNQARHAHQCHRSPRPRSPDRAASERQHIDRGRLLNGALKDPCAPRCTYQRQAGRPSRKGSKRCNQFPIFRRVACLGASLRGIALAASDPGGLSRRAGRRRVRQSSPGQECSTPPRGGAHGCPGHRLL